MIKFYIAFTRYEYIAIESREIRVSRVYAGEFIHNVSRMGLQYCEQIGSDI